MAEGSSTADTERLDGGVEVARHADGTLDERTGAHLSFRPQPADTLVGLRVRGRIKRTGLLLRTVFLTLWVGQWVLSTVGRGRVDAVSTVLFLFVVLVLCGYPRLQAASVQRLVGWQGEYRVTVSPAGITCANDHSALTQKWSVFRGYRETAGHFVLLSRDPNIMCLDVLPKRGAHEAGDLGRLRELLNEHTTRM
ncbi:YcxB family protein [Streptomyces sp. NPDC020403]|uniref:YcxB family protein n=1 Tax=unclassified Streptomyces TaxID=2593676 RepID=UPI0033C9E02B